MNNYRKLNEQEIRQLMEHSCTADDWTNIEVAIGFKADNVHYTRFSARLGWVFLSMSLSWQVA